MGSGCVGAIHLSWEGRRFRSFIYLMYVLAQFIVLIFAGVV